MFLSEHYIIIIGIIIIIINIILIFLEVKLPYDPVCLSVGRSVRQSVGLS